MPKNLLKVNIFCSPVIEMKPFKGEATVVSSENRLGKFDILPKHTNFITLIYNSLTIHFLDKKELTYQFERGVVEVSENKVNVFLGL